MEYGAAFSLDALNNLVVDTAAGRAMRSLTVLPRTLASLLARVALDGFAPHAKSAPRGLIEEGALDLIPRP